MTSTVTQARLAELYESRLADCLRFAGDVTPGADVQLVVVIERLNVAELATFVTRAASATEHGPAWAGNFTKCVLLAGSPRKVVGRFPRLPWHQGSSLALAGPVPASAVAGLRRLLRPLRFDVAGRHLTCAVPNGDGDVMQGSELLVATDGYSTPEVLVSLVHSLAEPTLLGRVSPKMPLTVRAVDRIEDLTGPLTYARIQPQGDVTAPAFRVSTVLRQCSPTGTHCATTAPPSGTEEST